MNRNFAVAYGRILRSLRRFPLPITSPKVAELV